MNDYITDFANVVLDAAIAWIWYGIFHFVYKRIRFARIKHIILCGSQAIMLFYMAQWILVGWIRSALVMLDLEGTNVLTTGTFITLIVVVTAAALPIGLFA